MIYNQSCPVRDLLCLQTQLTDAQKRITTLEAELAAAKVTGSSAIPAPCLRCLNRDPIFYRMLAQISQLPSFISQAWKGTGEYDEMRAKACASLFTDSIGMSRKVGCAVMFGLVFWHSERCPSEQSLSSTTSAAS